VRTVFPNGHPSHINNGFIKRLCFSTPISDGLITAQLTDHLYKWTSREMRQALTLFKREFTGMFAKRLPYH